jgi:tryptophanyl-tRNA synthetase
MLTPIQSRYTELMNDKAELGRLLRIGAEKAGQVAQATLARANNAIGFYPR